MMWSANSRADQSAATGGHPRRGPRRDETSHVNERPTNHDLTDVIKACTYVFHATTPLAPWNLRAMIHDRDEKTSSRKYKNDMK